MGDVELQIFADRLKELRISLGMTQSDFVKDLGITAAALSAYENNQKNPSISVAKRIAEKYDVSIDWLCGLCDKRKNNPIPENLSDILELLFLLDECTDIAIYEHTEEFQDVCLDGYPEFIERKTYEIGFNHYLINGIIQEWNKMRDLYRSGTIDDEVYLLWKEKTLRKWKSYSSNGSKNISGTEDEQLFL